MSRTGSRKQELPSKLSVQTSIKRSVPKRYIPNSHSFANIELVFKKTYGTKREQLEQNEFKFLLASAIKTVHGEYASEVDTLDYKIISDYVYRAIIRFRTAHHSRIVTALLLFGQWRDSDCRFEIIKISQTPCILSY